MAVETAQEARPAWFGTIGRLGIGAIILMAALRGWIWLFGVDAVMLSHALDRVLVIALVCYALVGSKKVRTGARLVIVVYLLTLLFFLIWHVVHPVSSSSAEAGTADRWTEYSKTEGNFAASFPQAPKQVLAEKDDGTTNKVITAVGNDKVIYEVVYSFGSERVPSEEDFNEGENALNKGSDKCSFDFERPASPALEGYMGRSYKAHCAGDTREFNLYLGKRHVFMNLVSWPTGAPEPAGAAKFLASFRLLDPDK